MLEVLLLSAAMGPSVFAMRCASSCRKWEKGETRTIANFLGEHMTLVKLPGALTNDARCPAQKRKNPPNGGFFLQGADVG